MYIMAGTPRAMSIDNIPATGIVMFNAEAMNITDRYMPNMKPSSATRQNGEYFSGAILLSMTAKIAIKRQ